MNDINNEALEKDNQGDEKADYEELRGEDIPAKKDNATAERKNLYFSGLVTGMLITFLCLLVVILVRKDYQNDKKADVDLAEVNNAEDIVNEKIKTLLDVVEDYYLEEYDKQELLEGMYGGLIEALGDPYSVYYTPEELNALMNQTQGIYYGIGAYIGFDTEKNMCYVSKLIKNTPAAASDLMPLDCIVKVDGVDAIGMDSSEIVTYIKGEIGTQVVLTVMREGSSELLDIAVTRDKIETPTVEHEMLENGIGYIEITEFDDVTYNQFMDAYNSLNDRHMKGMILDLRANPGGNVSTVCMIAREMLPKGLIVYTEDKYNKRVEYTCPGKNEIQIPMVVLIDGNSASASEILAGAIKDYEKGTLMGTTTFGKGIVQRVISISDGTALKLTVSNYFTPKGNYIHGVGIEPDIEVKWDYEKYAAEGIDNQKQAAYEYLLKEIK